MPGSGPRMKRACAFVLLVLGASCRREAAPRARAEFAGASVILISIDTLRADHLPAWGYRGVATPSLDRFRRDAILFRNAYSNCPMTLPSHVDAEDLYSSGLVGLLNAIRRYDTSSGTSFETYARVRIRGESQYR